MMNYYNSLIILYIIELLLISIFVIKIHYFNNYNILFNPILIFLIGSSFIYIFIPLIMMLLNLNWLPEHYSEMSYLKTNLILFSYIILVTIFYYFINKKINVNNNFKDLVFKKLNKKEKFFIIFLFFLPSLFTTIYLIKYALFFGIKNYLINRIILRKGMGLFVLISYLSIIILPTFFSNLLLNKKSKILKIILFFIFIVFPFLFSYIIMGNRLPAFIILIMLILNYIIILNKKINIKFIFKSSLIFLIIFLFFTFAGLYRLVQGNFDNINTKLIKKTYNIILEESLVKNFGNFEHLVWLIEHENNWEKLYGKTFLAGFINVIPRFIYKSKLLGGGPYLKNMIHPGSYDLSKSYITSYTTGIAIEMYMNFKIWGLLIIPFFHALFLFLLKILLNYVKGNLLLLNLYIYLLFTLSFLIMFSEFLGIYTQTLFLITPFFIFNYFKNKINEIDRRKIL